MERYWRPIITQRWSYLQGIFSTSKNHMIVLNKLILSGTFWCFLQGFEVCFCCFPTEQLIIVACLAMPTFMSKEPSECLCCGQDLQTENWIELHFSNSSNYNCYLFALSFWDFTLSKARNNCVHATEVLQPSKDSLFCSFSLIWLLFLSCRLSYVPAFLYFWSFERFCPVAQIHLDHFC
jgi:hypothetical protein